jgi:hypothetical protein
MQELKGGSQAGVCPSQNASKLNTLLGTGKIQRDTRTSGSFGGPQAGAVNVQILGNLHWMMLIQLERGHFGGDVQQAKARAVYVAGEATKRHSDLPTESGANLRFVRRSETFFCAVVCSAAVCSVAVPSFNCLWTTRGRRPQ